MNNWYSVVDKAEYADVYIYDTIGKFGVPAQALVTALTGLRSKTLNVYLASDGGEVKDGIAIYNALSRHNAPVNVYADSIVASIASVVMQAGQRRIMNPGSSLMIHDAWGIVSGDAAYMGKIANEFDATSNDIAGIYATKAGGTIEEWRDRMKTETWYRPQEAVDMGLADVVGTGGTRNEYTNRTFNLSNFKNVPEWVRNEATNPELPAVQPEPVTEVTVDEQAVRQALGLDDDGDIVGAIAGLKSQITTLTATIKSDAPDKGEAAQLRAELQAANQRIIEGEAEYNRNLLDSRERLATMQAEVRVEKAIGQGKITPANRDYALKVARDLDEDGWTRFVRTLPSVNLTELGSAADGADVEPTQEEASIARQMGIAPEELVKQKVRDLS